MSDSSSYDSTSKAGVTPMVLAEGVSKSFGSNEVLKSISLSVKPGEVLCIIGPSGSGKSTFLRCINHLERVDAGRLSVDGQVVGYRQHGDKLYELKPKEASRQRREIGMVFQRFNLFPHMTALENIVEAPVRVKGIPKARAVERANELLARVGLADKGDHYPSQLSGGQQQRVAIARAIAKRPTVLLADEPTGNLDESMRDEILALLQGLNDEGLTLVVVTHDSAVARRAKRRLRLSDGTVQDITR